MYKGTIPEMGRQDSTYNHRAPNPYEKVATLTQLFLLL